MLSTTVAILQPRPAPGFLVGRIGGALSGGGEGGNGGGGGVEGGVTGGASSSITLWTLLHEPAVGKSVSRAARRVSKRES